MNRYARIYPLGVSKCDKAPLLLAVSVGWSVGWLVTHSFDNPYVAPIGLLGLVINHLIFFIRVHATMSVCSFVHLLKGFLKSGKIDMDLI